MMAYSNNALSKNEITEFVKKTYRNNYSGFDERQWLRHFLKRNGEILKQSPLKLISSARVNDISLSSVEEFLSTLKLKLETFPVTADSVVNVDEFQLKYAGYSAGRKRITAYRFDGTPHKQISSKVRGGCIGSLITFIAADGTLLYSCLCLKSDGKCRTSGEVEVYYMMSDEMDRRGANTRSRPIPQIRLYTLSGMIDNVCWDIIYSKFMNYLHDITPGKKYLVFLDNLPEHTQVETVRKGVERGIEPFFLVKGTSQWSQPNDSYTFGTLRKEINKACSVRAPKSKESLNLIVRDILPDALAKSFTPTLIKASFEVTGLYPFNEEVIRKRCMENLGMVTDNTSTFEKIEKKSLDIKKLMTNPTPLTKKLGSDPTLYKTKHILQDMSWKPMKKRKGEKKRQIDSS